jgi:hypothetical protein
VGQLVAGVRADVGAVGCAWPHAAVRLANAASAVPESIAALRILTSDSRRMNAFQAQQAWLPHVISTHWLRLWFQASIEGQLDHQAGESHRRAVRVMALSLKSSIDDQLPAVYRTPEHKISNALWRPIRGRLS